MAVSGPINEPGSFIIELLSTLENTDLTAFFELANRKINIGKLAAIIQNQALLKAKEPIAHLDVLSKEYLNLIQSSNLNFLPPPEYREVGLPLDDASVEKVKQFTNKLFAVACQEILDEEGNLHEKIVKKFNVEKLKNAEDFRNAFLQGIACGITMILQTKDFQENYMAWIKVADKKYQHLSKNTAYQSHCKNGSYPEFVKRGVDKYFSEYQDPYFIDNHVKQHLLRKSFEKDPKQFFQKISAYLKELNELILTIVANKKIPDHELYMQYMEIYIKKMAAALEVMQVEKIPDFNVIISAINNMQINTDVLKKINMNLFRNKFSEQEQIEKKQLARIEEILTIFCEVFSHLQRKYSSAA